jgi:transcription antitermination factor NusG
MAEARGVSGDPDQPRDAVQPPEGGPAQDDALEEGPLRLYADRSWCALHTRARHEKKVAAACQRLELPSYLPLMIHRTFSGGKVNTFHLPMFSGYVFAALAPGDLATLKRTNSVAQRIEAPDQPALLADLRNVARVEAAQLEIQTAATLRRGQRVMVVSGPFAGVTGTVLRYKNRTRLQIAVGAIQRAIILDVSRDDLVAA